MNMEILVTGKDRPEDVAMRGYCLRFQDTSSHHRPFWIETEQGEGMDLSEQDVFDMMDHYFKDNF